MTFAEVVLDVPRGRAQQACFTNRLGHLVELVDLVRPRRRPFRVLDVELNGRGVVKRSARYKGRGGGPILGM